MGIQINNKRFLSRAGVSLLGVSLLAGSAFMLINRAPVTKADAINNTDFVMTVMPDLPGTSTDNQFTIPVAPGTTYNYTVDCNNDGVPEAVNQTGSYTCTYGASGGIHYKVRIGGTFPRIFFNGAGDRLKLVSVDQWGTTKWETMDRAFLGAENMDLKATDTPDLSNVTIATRMFGNASSLRGDNANWNWNTSTITNMSGMFTGASQFDANIGSWDVSNVAYMGNMFSRAQRFNNGGSDSINNWNTGKAVFIDSMFEGATSFNQSLASWKPSLLLSTPGNQYSGAPGMLDNTAMSLENYDATLTSWNSQTLKSPVILGAAGLKYCRATDSRAQLVAKGWTINGDSRDCPTHTLTFNTQSSVAAPAPQLIEYGAKATEPTAPTREGHTFDGWYTSTDYTTKWNFATDTMPDANVTLYAKWNINQYKIQYDANTGTGTTPDTVGNLGQSVKIAANAFTKPGHTFTGWNDQPNGSGKSYAAGDNYTIPARDLTLYAQWADQTPPATPTTAPDMSPFTDTGGNNSDNITNNKKPSFSVACTEAGSTVTLYIDGAANGTAQCQTAGRSVLVTPENDLADGSFSVTYSETDENDNESQPSPVLNITIDTQAPAAPGITVDNITADNIINGMEAAENHTITGTVTGAGPNDRVTITVNGTPQTVFIEANGKFQVSVPGADLVGDPNKIVKVIRLQSLMLPATPPHQL